MNVTTSSSTFLILFFLFTGSYSSSITNPLTGVGCALLNCGQGTCKALNETSTGVDCECYPGWKKFQIGPLTFPPCVVPNCTINLGCDAAAPTQPPSAQPVPPLLPPLNLSSPCSFAWCGDGVCLANGTSYTCKCSPEASNLMNMTNLPCLKPCSLGSDCENLGFSPPQILPSPSPFRAGLPSSPSPPSTVPGSATQGPSEDQNSAGSQRVMIALSLAAMLLTLSQHIH